MVRVLKLEKGHTMDDTNEAPTPEAAPVEAAAAPLAEAGTQETPPEVVTGCADDALPGDAEAPMEARLPEVVTGTPPVAMVFSGMNYAGQSSGLMGPDDLGNAQLAAAAQDRVARYTEALVSHTIRVTAVLRPRVNADHQATLDYIDARIDALIRHLSGWPDRRTDPAFSGLGL